MSDVVKQTDDGLSLRDLVRNALLSARASSPNAATLMDDVDFKLVDTDELLPDFVKMMTETANPNNSVSEHAKELHAVITVAREWESPIAEHSDLIKELKRDEKYAEMNGHDLLEYLDLLESLAGRLGEPGLLPLSIAQVGYAKTGEERSHDAFKKPDLPKLLVAEIEQALVDDMAEQPVVNIVEDSQHPQPPTPQSLQATDTESTPEVRQLGMDYLTPAQVHDVVAVAREWDLPPSKRGKTMRQVKVLWSRQGHDPMMVLPALDVVLDAIAARADQLDEQGWTPPSPLREEDYNQPEPVVGDEGMERPLIMTLLTDIAVVIGKDGKLELGEGISLIVV
ncbi:hypothetical protein B0A48_04697 [Cryoendolithus antarcticus]|uniref:Uncharacterized protein n=1 Tax=Cryoendolithus antarcticus TaxID=1507870 RepID=A0A1V8TD35_9PEZI|nr:hypothetical protein B0A48_04697 [Cryoendolithus antarcticus]